MGESVHLLNLRLCGDLGEVIVQFVKNLIIVDNEVLLFFCFLLDELEEHALLLVHFHFLFAFPGNSVLVFIGENTLIIA